MKKDILFDNSQATLNHFGYQTIFDSLSYGSNISVRVLDIKKFKRICTRIEKKLYFEFIKEFSIKFEAIILEKDFFTDKEFKPSLKRYTTVLLRKLTRVTSNLSDEAKSMLEKDINNVSNLENHWLSSISNALPLNTLFNFNKYWRFYSLIWLILNKDELKNKKNAWGLPEWHFEFYKTSTIDKSEKLLFVFGPILSAPKDFVIHGIQDKNYIDKIKLSHLIFCNITNNFFKPQYSPSISEMDKYTSNITVSPLYILDKKKQIFTNGWELILEYFLNRSKQENMLSSSELNTFNVISTIGRVASFLSYMDIYGKLPTKLNFYIKHHNSKDNKNLWIKYAKDINNTNISIEHLTDDIKYTKTIEEETLKFGCFITLDPYGKDIIFAYELKEIAIEYHLFIESIYARYRYEKNYFGTIMVVWLQNYFGVFNLNGSKDEEYEQVMNTLCEAFVEICRSDGCSLYFSKSNEEKIELTHSYYKYSPWKKNKEKIKKSFNRNNDCKNNIEKHLTGSEYYENFDIINDNDCFFNKFPDTDKVKSIIVLPINYFGRTIGYIAIQGAARYSLKTSMINTITRKLTHLGDYFYRQFFINYFLEINKKILISTTNKKDTFDFLAKEICKVFLSDGCLIRVVGKNDSNKLSLEGSYPSVENVYDYHLYKHEETITWSIVDKLRSENSKESIFHVTFNTTDDYTTDIENILSNNKVTVYKDLINKKASRKKLAEKYSHIDLIAIKDNDEKIIGIVTMCNKTKVLSENWKYTAKFLNSILLQGFQHLKLVEESNQTFIKVVTHEITRKIKLSANKAAEINNRLIKIIKLFNKLLYDKKSYVRDFNFLFKTIEHLDIDNKSEVLSILKNYNVNLLNIHGHLASVNLSSSQIGLHAKDIDFKMHQFKYRNETKKPIFNKTHKVSLDNMVKDALKPYLYTFTSKDIDIKVSIHKNLSVTNKVNDLMCDYMQDIFLNLIDNMAKYSSDHQTISIIYRDKKIIFSNVGIFLSKEECENIFSMEYRGLKLERLKEGDGMGLYIIEKYLNELKLSIEHNQTRDNDKNIHSFSINITAPHITYN